MASIEPDAPRDPPVDGLERLPSVDALLRHASISPLLSEYPRDEVVRAIRAALDSRREALRAGAQAGVDARDVARELRERLFERSRPSLRPVVNATGIVLHTGLGRAPLAEAAVEAAADAARGYCNLELDLLTGERGDRHEHVRGLLCELTGAEDALIVNNNAAATLLALAALARGRPVLVSRGQLVEIGGSYRMPDVMRASGCHMVEVGTTNRTRLDDYEAAMAGEPAVLLHVHTSNFRIRGFVQSVAVGELADLARRYAELRCTVVDDLGSGLLDVELLRRAVGSIHPQDDTAAFADWDEPSVRASVAAGAHLTLFSGDKLLGGPQAGIIVGRAALLAALRRDPLARALRPDKMTLAALEATLRLYRDPERLGARLPTLELLTRTPAETQRLATELAESLRAALPGLAVDVLADSAFAGGGALPTLELPTHVVAVEWSGLSADGLASALRRAPVPVIGRIRGGRVVFDARTLRTGDVETVAAAMCDALANRT